jgi:hypothetical protein
MSVDLDAANRLLQKKYSEVSDFDLPQKIKLENEVAKGLKSEPKFANNPSDWKMIAQERLQMLEQMRDEAHAWNEAYLEEKKRSDRLEARLFDVLDLNRTQPNQEIAEEKVVLKSPEQLSKRRANFFTQRKIYEDRNRAHDAGLDMEGKGNPEDDAS